MTDHYQTSIRNFGRALPQTAKFRESLRPIQPREFKVWSANIWPDGKPAKYRRKDETPLQEAWFYAAVINGIVQSSSPVGPFRTEAEARANAENWRWS